jgi:hypothetical protein
MKKKLLALILLGMMLLAAATKGRRPLDASTVLPKNTTSSSSLGE